MAKFLVESPHMPKECMAALDEMMAKDPKLLDKFDWGCMSGIHTGWAVIDASTETAAKDILPTASRSKARVIKLNKFTPEQVRASHQ